MIGCGVLDATHEHGAAVPCMAALVRPCMSLIAIWSRKAAMRFTTSIVVNWCAGPA